METGPWGWVRLTVWRLDKNVPSREKTWPRGKTERIIGSQGKSVRLEPSTFSLLQSLWSKFYFFPPHQSCFYFTDPTLNQFFVCLGCWLFGQSVGRFTHFLWSRVLSSGSFSASLASPIHVLISQCSNPLSKLSYTVSHPHLTFWPKSLF